MKVKSIQPSGSFEFQNKMFYTFEYEFEDGTSGYANHLTQEAPFKAGEDVFVEENGTSPKGDRKVKVKKPESAQYSGQNSTQSNSRYSPETQEQIMRQSCLSSAAAFYASRGQVSENDVVYTAQRWYEFAKTGNITPVRTEDTPF